MLFLALFTLFQTTQVANNFTPPLKVGEIRSETFNSCYLSSDEKAEDKGLPAKFCFQELGILLHPSDAFAQPELQIKTKDGKTTTYLLRKEKDISKPEDKWPNWIQVSVSLLPTTLSNTGEDRLYNRSLSLTFTIERNSGLVHAGSFKFRGVAQQMADNYHPIGEEEVSTYRFDD